VRIWRNKSKNSGLSWRFAGSKTFQLNMINYFCSHSLWCSYNKKKPRFKSSETEPSWFNQPESQISMSQVQPCSGDHPGGDVGREGEENIYSRQVKWAHRTLWMRPSLKMELLIFLNSSYRASTSLTLTAPSPHLKPVRETFAYIHIYIYPSR